MVPGADQRPNAFAAVVPVGREPVRHSPPRTTVADVANAVCSPRLVATPGPDLSLVSFQATDLAFPLPNSPLHARANAALQLLLTRDDGKDDDCHR
jgi:hypothetical protein